MEFKEYLQEYFGVTDFDNYWMDYDEDQILYQYVNYIATNEEGLSSGDFITKACSLEAESRFYESMYGVYGDGIPFYVAVQVGGEDAFVEFMHTFYLSYANELGYYAEETSTPAPSVLPTTAPAPLPTELGAVTPATVVMASDDISFVQLTGVQVFVMAIIAGIMIGKCIFSKF